jgi:hypothetical protein
VKRKLLAAASYWLPAGRAHLYALTKQKMAAVEKSEHARS